MAKMIQTSTVKHFTQLLILLGLLFPAVAWAEESPQALVNIQENSNKSIWQGQKYSFYVQLLSSTWFTGSPRFDLPDTKEGILYKIKGSPIQGSVKLQGQTYTSQLHEFWFFPQVSGSITLNEITVHFSTSTPAGQPAPHYSLKTKPFTVQVQPVPGAGIGETLIATTHLDVKQTWQPTSPGAVVGDAFTRTVVMKAESLAGIFLPEIIPENIEGISIYPAAPEVGDQTERGEASGTRKEIFTYLFEKEGEYFIEKINLRWWNTEKEQIETIELPGLQVSIAPNPNYQQAADAAPVKRDINLKLHVSLLGAALLCLYLLKRIMPLAKELLHRMHLKYSESEGAFFLKLKTSCKNNDPLGAYNRLYFWIKKCAPKNSGSLSKLGKKNGNQNLSREIASLDDVLFKPEKKDTAWQGKKLLKELSLLRKRYPSAAKQQMRQSSRFRING